MGPYLPGQEPSRNLPGDPDKPYVVPTVSGNLVPSSTVAGAYELEMPPNGAPSVSSPNSATIYLPGDVSDPGPVPTEEPTTENGGVSPWYQATGPVKVGVPVQNPDETRTAPNGRFLRTPGRAGAIEIGVEDYYQVRTTGMKPTSAQLMKTEDGRAVTAVQYENQYEVRRGPVGKVNGTPTTVTHPEWTPVSQEEVANLTRDNPQARANIPQPQMPKSFPDK